MKFYFEKRVLFGFGLALTSLVLLGVYAFQNSKKFAETSKLVSHTNEVLYHSERALTIILTMESNQRGYVLTGNKDFLTPIEYAVDTMHNHLQNLIRLTSDNANQQKRIQILIPLVANKVKFINTVVENRKVSFERALAIIHSLQGKHQMEEINQVFKDLQDEEKRLLQKRIALMEANFVEFNYALYALLSTTGLILTLVFIAIYFSLKARTKAELALKISSSELVDIYENAPCGYYSLDNRGFFVKANNTFLSWIGYNRSEIINVVKFSHILTNEGKAAFSENFPKFKLQGFIYNIEFDLIRKDGSCFPVILNSTAVTDDKGRYIRSRSTAFDITENKLAENKIKLLNKELEAFTYSVSHDLRSPLRSINGYAKILEEDYGAIIDGEGKRLMQVIINNAKRMGQLIDNLLDFSRIGRKELIKSNYDIDQLIHSIIQEQLESESHREIKFSFQKLYPAKCDIMMIRQVWENLISNAVKYSRKKDVAIIEIGSSIGNNEVIYFIKDNGVGFDMAYVNKLFGVFQRLHTIQDFEGTGVGLAIVYRIVTRHGGRVWTEAEVNKGATFFFTIPT